MTDNLKSRTYDDEHGNRKLLRFGPTVWQAIDALAADCNLKWFEWVNQIPETHGNRHADVRDVVVECFLKDRKRAQADREQQFQDSPLIGFAEKMGDAKFKADLAGDSVVIEACLDLGGFKLRVGLRDHEDCIWIENGMRGRPHLVIPLPDWSRKAAETKAAGTAA